MSLEFHLNQTSPTTATVDCVVVGVFADGTLAPAASVLDSASAGRLQSLVARGDVSGKTGKTTLLHDLPGIAAPRVLVIGLGDAGKFGVPQYLKAVADAVRTLKTGPVGSVLFTLSDVAVQDRDAAWNIRQAVIAADHTGYRYTATLGAKNSKREEKGLVRFEISGSDTTALAQGIAIAQGVQFTREVGNLPPNICNPAYLAQQAQDFAAQHTGVDCEVLDDAAMEALGMGSLLAVARGSAQRPRLIVLKWSQGGDAKPYVLVGKGITFDTGGVNLKTQGGIEEMKYDMCGAGSVLGTFVAAVKMQLPVNLVCIAAAVENAIDGDAYRPSDVITSMSGKTIEVGNTDAEGRLILCDALTYAQRFEPAALVDVATLTGACMVALGKYATGVMTKRSHDLARELLDAGEMVFDRGWQLPLWDEYQPMLDSAFADVYNIGGRWAGAITAGCFLSRFTDGQRWVHLDIAGSASDDGKLGMATGRPVGMLSQWLLDRSAA
ncbi:MULTISPECIES: leucyl aminopeptidase [Thermomonas]|jgi:leucyl aminopeptidase|uniref:Probable cytosol aminopeptidase n=1 Tax=Thermomonas beijingensis TaxID=2872701 RepID=A0ABS7TAN1_9GAMM|nr:MULTISPECIES: leucyl aminopeptidase [Thermomonas]MDE2382206.1 leucyl aminopeptidase [Xanthomonadaceae bacterium]MBZ4184868.1 leucyl aminopeptidase [Thermomonas beijingensis]HOC11281.1 leucyl aminopeptidase [Thermomonas sp.]HQA03022.1 leucyl aminopeptidase [Thermomonas sp.]HQE07930.1 leucyl aminopeptidase [Thermomonas sp.]